MIHKKIKIRTKGSGEDAYISTYFIEPTEQIPAAPMPLLPTGRPSPWPSVFWPRESTW